MALKSSNRAFRDHTVMSTTGSEQRRARGHWFLGAPTQRTFERVIDGELRADHHEHLVAEIVGAVRGVSLLSTEYTSQLAAVGRTLTWKGLTTGGFVSISVLPRDGKTVIRIEVNARKLAGDLVVGTVGGGLALGANAGWLIPRLLHLPVVVGVVIAAAIVVGAYAGARALYASRVRHVFGVMSKLADRLEERTKALVAPR
jgi:hypothetical protein